MGNIFTSGFTFIAHKAADHTMPSNTLESMQRMHKKGAKCFEIDCFMMKDGNIAVIHDDEIHIATTGKGKITKKSGFDLLDVFVIGGDGGEKIPMLEELMEYVVTHNLYLMIEVKDKNLSIVDKIDELIKSYHCNLFTVYSFERKIIEAFAKKKSDYQIQWNMIKLTRYKLQKAKEFGVGINLDGRYVTQSDIEKIKAIGQQIHVYTVNSFDHAKKLLDLGVDAIITDTLIGGE